MTAFFALKIASLLPLKMLTERSLFFANKTLGKGLITIRAMSLPPDKASDWHGKKQNGHNNIGHSNLLDLIPEKNYKRDFGIPKISPLI